MKCIICHSEDIRRTEVREEVKVGKNIVYVPIRTPVCRACGERYYDRRTMRYLEDVEEKLKSGKAPLQEIGKILELAG